MVRSRQFSLCTVFTICLLLLTIPAAAQEDNDMPLLGPLNSDPLTERGISPRVLDIADIRNRVAPIARTEVHIVKLSVCLHC